MRTTRPDSGRSARVTPPRRREELRAEARHHRDRRDLYRAKVYGPRPTSSTRLGELERIAEVSDRRARRAEQEGAGEGGGVKGGD
jgi:hypothetical protein